MSFFKKNLFLKFFSRKNIKSAPDFNFQNTISFSNEIFYLSEFKIQAPRCRVDAGEIVFIIGSNGSGKTTFLKGLSGLLNYKEQRAFYMSPHFSPQSGLTGRDLFDLFEIWDSIFYRAELLDEFKIKDLLSVPLEELSSGERQKVFLLAIFFHKSRVVALDEPLSYLDVSYYSLLMKTIEMYSKEGRTFFISNHDFNWSLSFKKSQTWVVFQNRFCLCGLTPKVLGDIKLREAFGVNFRVVTTDTRSLVVIEEI